MSEAAAGLGGLSPLFGMTREQLEQLLENAAERGAAKVLRQGGAQLPAALTNAQVISRYFNGSAGAWRNFLCRNKDELEKCGDGKGRLRRWDAAKLEATIQRLARQRGGTR